MLEQIQTIGFAGFTRENLNKVLCVVPPFDTLIHFGALWRTTMQYEDNLFRGIDSAWMTSHINCWQRIISTRDIPTKNSRITFMSGENGRDFIMDFYHWPDKQPPVLCYSVALSCLELHNWQISLSVFDPAGEVVAADLILQSGKILEYGHEVVVNNLAMKFGKLFAMALLELCGETYAASVLWDLTMENAN